MMSRSLLASIAPAFTLAAALTACGDVTTVELGDFRCVTSPCEANFGELNVNRPGQTAKVIVENVGTGELELETIQLEATSDNIRFSDVTIFYLGDETGYDWQVDATGHAFASTAPYVLRPFQRLEIEISFTPSGDGHECPGDATAGGTVHCGDIVLVSNDVHPEDAEIRAPILLSVGDTRMEVSPTIISFAPAELINAGTGQYAEQRRELTVTNLGSGNMALQSITADTSEIQVEDQSAASFPITMIGGSQRTFDVIWTPTSAEPLDAQLTVRSNAIEGPTRVVLVNSEGEETPDIEIDPCGFEFGEVAVGTTEEILFDVTNTGSAALTWQVTITDVTPSAARDDLDIQTPTGEPAMGNQDPLAPEQTRTLKVVYAPTEARSVMAQVSFRGNVPSRACSLSAGEAVALAEVAPTQIYWGGMDPGDSETRSFVVYNLGLAELEVTSINETGDTHAEWEVDVLAAGGFTVAPGGSRRVDVTYTRADDDVPAQDTATLTIHHNGMGTGTNQVFLTATHGDEFLPPSCSLAANPEAPYEVGDTVTLDASGSTLNAGEWATNQFQWNLVRPAGSEATLSDEHGAAVTLEFDAPGTYTVGMIATANIEGDAVSCEITRTLAVAE